MIKKILEWNESDFSDSGSYEVGYDQQMVGPGWRQEVRQVGRETTEDTGG